MNQRDFLFRIFNMLYCCMFIFKHQIMFKFLMINFDAYFKNVLTAILILTNVVLILHVNHLCYFNSMSFLPNGDLIWS